jgi:hypothetical protein
MRDRFGDHFTGGMGAEAVRDLLDNLDLDAESSSCVPRSPTPRARRSSVPPSG